jgi:hypothetical protein
VSEYSETLKQSINNYILPVLEEIMTGDYDSEILPAIIKTRLIEVCAKDQRIEKIEDIIISEGDESINISSMIVKPVNSNAIEIV